MEFVYTVIVSLQLGHTMQHLLCTKHNGVVRYCNHPVSESDSMSHKWTKTAICNCVVSSKCFQARDKPLKKLFSPRSFVVNPVSFFGHGLQGVLYVQLMRLLPIYCSSSLVSRKHALCF